KLELGGNSRPTALPVILKTAIEVSTAQGQDRVGSADGPEHSRTFEARSDHGFASSFDDAGTDEEVLAAELGVAHALGVPFEIIGFRADLLRDCGMAGGEGAEHAHELFDFPLVQQALLVKLYPGLQLRGIIRVELACQLPQMLTSVVKIDNVQGAGKMQSGQMPNPFRSVAHHHLPEGTAPAPFPG